MKQIAESLPPTLGLQTLNALCQRTTRKSLADWEEIWRDRRRALRAWENTERRWCSAVLGVQSYAALERHPFTLEQREAWGRRYGVEDRDFSCHDLKAGELLVHAWFWTGTPA